MGEGTMVICRRGCVTSTPPACSTNWAGEKKLPWHTHMMLTSDFVYLYKNPVMVRPLGPLPVAETQGICRIEAAPSRPVGGGLIMHMSVVEQVVSDCGCWMADALVLWSWHTRAGSASDDELLISSLSFWCVPKLLEWLPVSLLLPPENSSTTYITSILGLRNVYSQFWAMPMPMPYIQSSRMSTYVINQQSVLFTQTILLFNIIMLEYIRSFS